MLKSAFPDSQSSLNINMLMVLIRHLHIQIGLLGSFPELPRTASTTGLDFSVLASLCSENECLIWFTWDKIVPFLTIKVNRTVNDINKRKKSAYNLPIHQTASGRR